MSDAYTCVHCREAILGKMYGAGDGTGQKFACPECHWRREAAAAKAHEDREDEKAKRLAAQEEREDFRRQWRAEVAALKHTAPSAPVRTAEPGRDDRLLKIAALFNSWANGDEPEGAPSARRTLLAIGDVLGDPFGAADMAEGERAGELKTCDEVFEEGAVRAVCDLEPHEGGTHRGWAWERRPGGRISWPASPGTGERGG